MAEHRPFGKPDLLDELAENDKARLPPLYEADPDAPDTACEICMAPGGYRCAEAALVHGRVPE